MEARSSGASPVRRSRRIMDLATTSSAADRANPQIPLPAIHPAVSILNDSSPLRSLRQHPYAPRFVPMPSRGANEPSPAAGRVRPRSPFQVRSARITVDPFQTAASLLRFGEDGGRTAQPGHGRRAEQGVITRSGAVRISSSGSQVSTSSVADLATFPTAPRNERVMPIGRGVSDDGGQQALTRLRTDIKMMGTPEMKIRLLREAREMTEQYMPYCQAAPKADNLLEWAAVFEGPPDTPYEGGVFFADIGIPLMYPHKPPTVTFTTQIYHCNIGPFGDVDCIGWKKNWQPTDTLAAMMQKLVALFFVPDPEYAVRSVEAQKLKDDPEGYEAMARLWTQRYAT